jgi:hypothetical protein
MRWGFGAFALAVGCAAGGDGVTTFGSTSPATDPTATSTTDAETGPLDTTGDGATTTSGADGTSDGSSDATSSAVGTDESTDTGAVLPCEAELETFAANPGWTVQGLPDAGTVFGWGMTAYAGGDLGEIGGTLQRAGTMQYYADTTIAITAGGCISASGLLVATMEDSDYNSVFGFGHFSTGGGPHVGWSFAEADNSTLRVSVNAGGFSEQLFVMDDISTPRAWSYEYDPARATVTLTMDGLGSESRPVAADQIGDVAAIDAFGMFKTPHENPDAYTGQLGLYLDEIAYTR